MPDDTKKLHHEDEIEEEDDSQKKIAGKHDSGAADLAKVNVNYAYFDEESQGDSPNQQFSGAMSIIDSKRSKEDAERVARQKELDKVTIRKEDVNLIMQEMEISRTEAELKLRQAFGNVVQALVTIINE